jgi:hypothetical protein
MNNMRYAPTAKLRWIDREYWGEFNNKKTVTVLEQWYQREVLTEQYGWQPIEGGEWKEVPTEKSNAI